MSTPEFVQRTASASLRGIPAVNEAERESDRGTAFDAGSLAYNDRDTAEARGVAGRGIFQGQEYDSFRHECIGRGSRISRGSISGFADILCQRWVEMRRRSGSTFGI